MSQKSQQKTFDLISNLYANPGLFYDVTTGNNIPVGNLAQPVAPSLGYSANVGWDAVTGLGSPNGTAILQAFGGNEPIYFGDIRNGSVTGYAVSNSGVVSQFSSSAGYCPLSYTAAGLLNDPNGFWACVRNDLVGGQLYVGKATNNSAAGYFISGGAVISDRPVGWDTCGIGTLVAHKFDANGFWICQGQPTPPGPPAPIFLGDVRNNSATGYLVSKNSITFLNMPGWNWCPNGYSLAGTLFDPNGFWACVLNGTPKGTNEFFGKVIDNAGTGYRVNAGNVSSVGGVGWDTCDVGTLLAHKFDANGFWVCEGQ